MNRERRIFVLAAAALASSAGALLACGLTTDYSGLQGGTRDGGPPGATPDASVPSDGGAAAPLDGSADGSFCASLSPAPRLCADFDEKQPVGTGWTSIDTTANATVKIDSIGYSPPASMLSAITTDDVPASARLHEALPLQTTQIHVEFQLLLPGGGGPFELCAIHETAADGTDYGLFYKQEQGRLLVYLGALQADGGLAQYVYPLGAPPAQWLHVAIDFGISAEGGTIVVKHDGTDVVNETGLASATVGATQLFVALGFYSPNGATAQADFDNVVIDWP